VKSLVVASALLCGAEDVAERTVVVVKDTKTFTVNKADVIRLVGKGIAGAKIGIKIEGPAKVEATNNVREVVGGRPVIGNLVKEFDLRATDSGKVTAIVTVTPPQPDAQPKVTKYEFEVR
jgi:hypothetical protein